MDEYNQAITILIVFYLPLIFGRQVYSSEINNIKKPYIKFLYLTNEDDITLISWIGDNEH